MKASPAPDSGFLPHAELLKPLPERSPFNAVWYADRRAFYELKKSFNRVYVAPVNTTVIEAKIRKSDIPQYTVKIRTEEARELARYARQKIMDSIRDFPSTPIVLAPQPGERTLVIEMAIVELTPTNAAFNIFGTTAGLLIPGSGLLRRLARGGIAMETLIRNGETNEILIELKDREADKAAPFTVRDFQEYGHARRIIDEWAKVFGELAATSYDHQVKGLDAITWNPL